MHVLDFIMWLVSSRVLWFFMDHVSDGTLTKAPESIRGYFYMILYWICYFLFFVVLDYNWIDFFRWIAHYNFAQTFKL